MTIDERDLARLTGGDLDLDEQPLPELEPISADPGDQGDETPRRRPRGRPAQGPNRPRTGRVQTLRDRINAYNAALEAKAKRGEEKAQESPPAPSRSVARRVAAQTGRPAPTFDTPAEPAKPHRKAWQRRAPAPGPADQTILEAIGKLTADQLLDRVRRALRVLLEG